MSTELPPPYVITEPYWMSNVRAMIEYILAWHKAGGPRFPRDKQQAITAALMESYVADLKTQKVALDNSIKTVEKIHQILQKPEVETE